MVGVFPELGISVPGGDIKGKIKDDLVVFLWKQTLEHRDATLETRSVPYLEGKIGA